MLTIYLALNIKINLSEQHVLMESTRHFYLYLINGIAATAVHYAVFTSNIFIFEFASAGIANLIASIFGIITSFLGNRYFVFKNLDRNIFDQGLNFFLLYSVIAAMNGLILYIWSDRIGLSYNLGFVLATALQFILSFYGNKFLIFK